MTVAEFTSELIRAANEMDRLAPHERTNLLQRAAATIRDQRDEIAFSISPANDRGPGDIAHELRSMADHVQTIPAAEVAAALLEAVEVIKASRVLLEEKRKIEDGEE